MHWRDIRSDAGVWSELEFQVQARRATWQVEGTAGRLRLSRCGVPVLWARLHRAHEGAWWLRAGAAETSPVEPLTSADVSGVQGVPLSDAWFAGWARAYARALDASGASPLHTGTWRLSCLVAAEEAEQHGGQLRLPWRERVECVAGYLAQPEGDFESWMLSGSNALLGLRAPPDAACARVKAWRKRARDGTLPPVLLLFVSPLDMWVVLDGHVRLTAALVERVPVPLLGLWSIRAYATAAHRAMQQGVLQRYALLNSEESPSLQRLDTATLNALAIQAWDNRPLLVPKTRGVPLRGGVVAWRSQVASRLEVVGEGVAPDVRSGLLRD